MNLLDIYESGAVARYHAKRAHTHQTVADHAWGVALVLMWMYHPQLPPSKSFQRALLHDAPELITGDVPAPAKWRSPELKAALTKLEQEISEEMGLPVFDYEDPLHDFCDNAELVMHCIAQYKMGNTHFYRTAFRGLDKIKQIIQHMPEGDMMLRAQGLYNSLRNEVNHVR